MIDKVFEISEDVRYVALYRDGHLETQSKTNTEGASSSESDKYEELLVNPIMLKAASQRGNIDCGGLDFLLVRYGNFFNSSYHCHGGIFQYVLKKTQTLLKLAKRLKLFLKKI
jgi:hypothetical protein